MANPYKRYHHRPTIIGTIFAFLLAEVLTSLLFHCDNPSNILTNLEETTKLTSTITTTTITSWLQKLYQPPVIYAEAKGVAGLGKAGGDGTGGSDKAGQQVPPEVYNALSYAGSIFLLILSVPFVCFGLNKLLNKIEDCFGCGPSSQKEKQRQRLTSSTRNPGDAPNLGNNLNNKISLATDERLRKKRDEFRGPSLSRKQPHQKTSNHNLIGDHNHQHQQPPALHQLNGTSLLHQNQQFQLDQLQQQLQQQAQLSQQQQQKLSKNNTNLSHYDSSYEFVSITPDQNNNNHNNHHQQQQHQFNGQAPGLMTPGGAIKLPFSASNNSSSSNSNKGNNVDG